MFESLTKISDVWMTHSNTEDDHLASTQLHTAMNADEKPLVGSTTPAAGLNPTVFNGGNYYPYQPYQEGFATGALPLPPQKKKRANDVGEKSPRCARCIECCGLYSHDCLGKFIKKNCCFFTENGERILCSVCMQNDCDGGRMGKEGREPQFCRTKGGASVVMCPELINYKTDCNDVKKPFPPAPLRHITFPSNKACQWSLDEKKRIITADFTSNRVPKSDLEFLLSLYEMEDAVVIATGLGKDTLLSGDDVLEVLTNTNAYHSVKQVSVDKIKVFEFKKEGDKLTVKKVQQRNKYRTLEEFFQSLYRESEETSEEKRTTFSKEYLLDYPLDNLRELQEDFKANFLISDILPGGGKCLLSVSVFDFFSTSLFLLSNILHPFRLHSTALMMLAIWVL